jgi:hypothetical protein
MVPSSQVFVERFLIRQLYAKQAVFPRAKAGDPKTAGDIASRGKACYSKKC